MPIIEDLVTSGRIVDVMIALVVLEVLALTLYRRRTGAGVAELSLAANAAAGISLMLALRAGLTDAGWATVALCLLFALVFHAADIGQRWSPRAGAADGREAP